MTWNALILLLVLTVTSAQAVTWEVAVLFLVPEGTKEFQQDVDANILELAGAKFGENLKLAVLRDFVGKRVEYLVDPKAATEHDWRPLFFSETVPRIMVAGDLRAYATKRPLLRDPTAFRLFLSKAFRDPNSRRALVIYAHGLGFVGLEKLPLKEVLTGEDLISWLGEVPAREGKKPLDLLWFDSCFMASVEAATELRNVTNFWIGSEDAEFSAGAPFDALSILADGPEDTAAVGTQIADRFLESYSRALFNQRRKVFSERAATISVIETEKLANLLDAIAAAADKVTPLTPAEAKRVGEIPSLAMRGLVDLGATLIALPREFHSAANLLELSSPKTRVRRKAHRDRFVFYRKRPNNPLVFNGFTRLPGNSTSFSGLNIARPLVGLPSSEYADLEFELVTGWGRISVH